MSFLILNTRPIEGGGHERLNALITSIGDLPYSLPLLQTQAIDFTPPDLNQFHYLIFVSQAAVHGFMRQTTQNIPSCCQCICIGKATANTLDEYGIKVAYFSADATSELLINAPIFNNIKDKKVLWIKGNKGRRVIEDGLLAKKAKITELQVYRTILPNYPLSTINQIATSAIDIVILTSEQSILHYHHLFQDYPQMFKLPCVLVLSTRLAILAKKYFKGHILISRHDLILPSIQTYKDSL